MRRIRPEELLVRPFDLLDREWALLVGGTAPPNPMTVSWGGFGTLWHRPMVTIYVRPTRHTFSLLEAQPAFTLNFLPPEFRPALEVCGKRSGRETDKWQATGLHPHPSAEVAVPRVAEARLAFECRALAWQDFDPEQFLDRTLEENYPLRDYHRLFFGEVLALWSAD